MSVAVPAHRRHVLRRSRSHRSIRPRTVDPPASDALPLRPAIPRSARGVFRGDGLHVLPENPML